MVNIKREVLRVDGMSCSSCELRIEMAINKLEGIKESKAIYSSSKVYITFNEDYVGLSNIINTIEKAGYIVSQGTSVNGKEVEMMSRLKRLINDFLRKLAQQNQEQFGIEKLDCCKLDRPNQNSEKYKKNNEV